MSVKISRSIRPVLNLPLPWEKVWPHYRRWSRTAQGENAVVSYLLAHPKFLVSELKKRKILVPELHLGGTEVVFPKKKGEKGRYRKADLIYRSGKNFIVVEAKENDEKGALGGAEYYARLLRDHLKDNDLEYGWIKPIAIRISGYPKGSSRGWKLGTILHSSGRKSVDE